MGKLNYTVEGFQHCVAINEAASWNLLHADLVLKDGVAWNHYGGRPLRDMPSPPAWNGRGCDQPFVRRTSPRKVCAALQALTGCKLLCQMFLL